MDDIKQKLQEFDKKLEGTDYSGRLLEKSPLVCIALGLIFGIAAQNFFSLNLWIWLSIASFFAAISLGLFFFYKKPGKTKLLACAAFICAISLGGIRLTHYGQPTSNDIRCCVTDNEILGCVRGVILNKPYTEYDKQWYFSNFTFSDPGTSFYLDISEAKTAEGWLPLSGKIRVTVEEPVLDLKQGDKIEVRCWLRKYRPASNPGQFNFSEYLKRKNVYVGAAVKSKDSISLLKDKPRAFIPALRSILRQSATQALIGTQNPENESQNLLQALILGYRSDISKETYEAFRRTGLSHFVSLSGMNFVILIGTIWWFCKLLGLSKQIRGLICAITSVIFLFTIPPAAPAARAAIICFVFCASLFFLRTPNSFNSLSLSAIILLLIVPTDLYDAGWQLSFATVLGILLLTDKIEKPLAAAVNYITDSTYFRQLTYYEKIKKFLLPVATLFAASLAAWLASSGIILYHFYTVNIFTSVWTLAASPLISIISVLGYIKAVLGVVLPTATIPLGLILEVLCSLLIDLVKFFNSLNISEVLVGKVQIIIILFYYVLVLYAGFVFTGRRLIKGFIISAGIITLILSLAAIKMQNSLSRSLAITVLDAGHGQAVFVQLPNNTNLIFDAGSITKNDIGKNIIKPFLSTKAVTRIDKIFLSHPDLDHINAVPEVIKDYKINSISANKAFFSSEKYLSPLAHLKKFISKHKLRFEYHKPKINFNSESKLSCIWPNNKASVQSSGINDLSTVFLLEFCGRKILFCSDIEQTAQKQILNLYPDLKADIMVVPHHGSEKTLAAEFIQRVKPQILIASCGSQQYEKIKDLKVLGNSTYYYTAKDGAVTINIDRKGIVSVNTFLK